MAWARCPAGAGATAGPVASLSGDSLTWAGFAPLNPAAAYVASSHNLLWKSDDDGQTWQVNASCDSIAFSPVDPDLRYEPCLSTLRRTTDDGATWTPLPMLDDQDQLAGLDVADDGTLYAGPLSPELPCPPTRERAGSPTTVIFRRCR